MDNLNIDIRPDKPSPIAVKIGPTFAFQKSLIPSVTSPTILVELLPSPFVAANNFKNLSCLPGLA